MCSEWVPRLVCGGAGFDFERCPAFIGEFGLVLGTAARVGVDVEHGPSDGLLVGGSVLPYAFGLWFATATGRSESPVCLRTLSIKQKFDLILTYTCCIEFESAIRLLSTKSILGSCTMDDNGVRETLDSLLAADPDVMDRDQLAGFVSQLGRVRGWCAAAEVRVSRRTRQLAAEGRSESAAALLSDNGRCSSKDAHTASERETICGVMPSFEDALAAGAVSAAHVDALAAATRNLNDQLLAEFVACEADLLTDAGNQGVDVFERGCRELARHIAAQARANADADELDEQRRNSSVKQWTDKLTGMRKTLLSLDPVRDTELWTAVNAKLASLRQADGTNGTPFDQLQVEAFIASCHG